MVPAKKNARKKAGRPAAARKKVARKKVARKKSVKRNAASMAGFVKVPRGVTHVKVVRRGKRLAVVGARA
jgi:hypothetical protein